MEAAEDSVGSGRGTIVGMKWMKNPQHWREGQIGNGMGYPWIFMGFLVINMYRKNL